MCLCPPKSIVSGEFENGGSKGDFGNKRTESRTGPRGLLAALQSFFPGQLLVSGLSPPGVKIVGGQMELPRKCVYSEAATMQPALGQQEVTADDNGDDKGK